MKITEILESNVYSLKTGKQIVPQQVTAKQAFGNSIANEIENLGVTFVEKPDYWEDLQSDYDSARPVDQLTLRRITKFLNQRGLDLNTYSARDIYGSTPRGPTAQVLNMPEETVFIVDVNGQRFLVNRHGAKSYIRNWAAIA